MEWHLDNAPSVRSQVSRQDRFLFRAIHWVEGLQRLLPVKLLGRALPMLRKQLNVCLKPEVIFGVYPGTVSKPSRKKKLFLAAVG